ncbi:unnamed protein product [Bemisia tabaci]|uniref:GOST seven transmembrane domain-containing protein n=1 Tax=Bemisia tabaci TaxID=7038 RepID=A0A9P0AD68_BEMTA|nr:unnamed protein product [Bemisia tabaci]
MFTRAFSNTEFPMVFVTKIISFLLCTSLFSFGVHAFADQGIWDITMNETNTMYAQTKSLFKKSTISVQINCDAMSISATVRVQWIIAETNCWQHYAFLKNDLSRLWVENIVSNLDNFTMPHVESIPRIYNCSSHIDVFRDWPPNKNLPVSKEPEKEAHDFISRRSADQDEMGSKLSLKTPHNTPSKRSSFPITKDGIYLLILKIEPGMQMNREPFNASVHIEMKGDYGYLSASDWPLLPFYEIMCIIYIILGVIWLILSALQWQDLLRIQFWIGGVIFLGMLEKATFYAEYRSINVTGKSALDGAAMIAELVSCAKRALARMLVIIVSVGFGIVKPRLGPVLHQVLGVGALYFIFASVEAYVRVTSLYHDMSKAMYFASIPLAILDSSICWWIFTSLVQTTRVLRLRRNVVKLTLYRHFTNTLIFAVVASIVFMLYSIKAFRLPACLKDWKELWVDEAFWHFLFSVILLVIMILWRPTNNNQRYAHTSLLDGSEDEEDEEEERFINDAYGVKLRGFGSRSNSPTRNKSASTTNSPEEDLKWVEENIPTALVDTTLPILDSDEEVMTTRFEISKMQ